MITSSEEIIIYESPDGGKTVYSRRSKSGDRTLVKEDPQDQLIARWHEWRNILALANDNPGLNDAVRQAELVYTLIKQHNT